MLIRRDVLEAIAAERVTMLFRTWSKPLVRAGGTQRTSVGVVAIGTVQPAAAAALTEEDARAVLTMKAATNQGSRLKTGSAAKIYEYLRDKHQGIKSRELQQLYRLEEINALLPDLNELCKNREVMVLVDELDKAGTPRRTRNRSSLASSRRRCRSTTRRRTSGS